MSSIHILDLPTEIVDNILQAAILARVCPVGTPRKYDSPSGIPRVLRLRLVCKTFDALFQPALFATRIFDTYLPLSSDQATQTLRYWPTRRNHGAQKLWHSYLVYRVLNEENPLVHRYVEVRQTAERLFQMNPPELSLSSIIDSLCWLALSSVAGRVASKSYPGHFVIPNGPDVGLLSAAAYLNCKGLAKSLLKEGVDPTHHDDLFPAAIEAAALAGHADMLQILQESLPDVIHTSQDPIANPRGFIGHPTLPTVLCKGKADPQAVVGAAMNGNIDILKLALYPPSRGNIERENYFDQPYGEVVERSRPGITLRAAMLHAKSVAVYRTLRFWFAANPSELHFFHRLERFCEFGNLEIVTHLLNNGVHVDGWGSPKYPSPLHEAARHGYEDIVELLIERGADVNKRCGRYKTPLASAVSGGFLTIAQKLIDKGARCDMDVLKKALASEYPAMARLLLLQCSAKEIYSNLEYLTDLKTPLDLAPVLEIIGEHPGLSYKNGKIRPPVPPKGERLLCYRLRHVGKISNRTPSGKVASSSRSEASRLLYLERKNLGREK